MRTLAPRALLDVLAGAARTAWGRALAVALAVLLTATTALGLTGGLRSAHVEEARVVAGEPLEVGPVRVTVLDHLVTDEILVDALADDGADAWLAVRLEVAATEDRTVGFLPDMVLPPEGVVLDLGEEGAYEYPREILVSDGSEFPEIHPGLPEQVLLVWPVAEVADVPEDLEVTLLGAEQYYSLNSQSMQWADEVPVARVVVPRTERVPPAVLARLGGEPL